MAGWDITRHADQQPLVDRHRGAADAHGGVRRQERHDVSDIGRCRHVAAQQVERRGAGLDWQVGRHSPH
jgi:hypothetical protein